MVFLKLADIFYNEKSEIKLPQNETTYSWSFDRQGNMDSLEQTLKMKGDLISLTYLPKYDRTTVVQKMKGKTKKEILGGMVILKVKTEKGEIKYEY